MKKPDEIKKWMERCAKLQCSGDVEKCPWDCGSAKCIGDLLLDALVYIQRLEADNAQQVRLIENLTDKLNATNEALPRWISVEEKKPPKHMKEYLCWCALDDDPEHKCDWAMVLRWHAIEGNGVVDRPHFTDEGVNGMYVTHWMPLPEPPKGV